jgi:hypothetical protein
MAAELTTTLEDSEAAAAAAQAEQDATGEHVVGYGCLAADRVFLALVPGQRHQVYNLAIPQCPGCDESHTVKAMPRPRRPHDVIAVSVDPPVTGQSKGLRSSPKSDTDVCAAIPEEWTLVTDMATTLGYGNRGSLVNRLREMRQRGAGIETRQEGRNKPMYVRRVAKVEE